MRISSGVLFLVVFKRIEGSRLMRFGPMIPDSLRGGLVIKHPRVQTIFADHQNHRACFPEIE
jgi:hypothetical protein